MRFVDLIEKKKNGYSLTPEEIHFFIEGYVAGRIPDYQVSAFLMAVCFQSMEEEETACLCKEMLESGDQVDLSSCGGVLCDKHSTGGVGDKTSLALIPMVAACGLKVAKMSGRGLGHTGGTLDKLESIPGFQTSLSMHAFLQQIKEIGLAIISQSASLVPADKMLYALRDVTATVDSIPLIAASIMSKKLACGSDCILLDVKYGEGAFMKDVQSAKKLAKEMIAIGTHFHKDTKAMISSMEEPLGNAIGNALEVKEAILSLQGKGPADFMELCLEAGSIMLLQGKMAKDKEEAYRKLEAAVSSGAALEKLREMIAAQHGDVSVIDHTDCLPQAKLVLPIYASQEGYIHRIHAMRIGTLAMRLGAGRLTKDDIIDPAAGIVLQKKSSDIIEKGAVLAYVHTNRELEEGWLQEFYECYEIHSFAKEKEVLIQGIIG